MPLWVQILLAAGIMFAAFQVYLYATGSPKFWHAVARNPGLALELFEAHPDWIVSASRVPSELTDETIRKQWVGPFRFYSIDRRLLYLWGRYDGLEKSQAEILGEIGREGNHH